ncbi:MAG: LPXTG cell wall anchor domain-containing protein [Ruminococcus sp.]
MKKVVSIFAALLLVAISVVSAFAADVNANEKKVLDELKTSVKMQGTDMYLPDAFVNQAENYFNTIDMTAEQADKILEVIKFGKSQLEATGAKNIADCTTAQKKELMATLVKVMAPVNGTASYDKATGEITLKSEKGEVIFKAVPTLVAKGGGKSVDVNGKTTDGGVIKTTGASANTMVFVVVGAAAVLAIAGGVFFVVKKRG